MLGARVAPRRATLVCSGGGRRMRLSRGLRHASYTPVRVDFVGWCCGLALGVSSHRAVHAANSSVLCDVIRERRSAGVASVLSGLFSVSSIPECEYGTGGGVNTYVACAYRPGTVLYKYNTLAVSGAIPVEF